MIVYRPIKRDSPRLAFRNSPWGDIPTIILDILTRFNINRNIALEFGVEYGYSTSAFANYFENVIGVDTFTGDMHSGFKSDHQSITKGRLASFPNIKLIKSTYQDFIKHDNSQYDLIHIDIVHTYKDTFDCGDWSVEHAQIVVFHDTISYPDVMKAVTELAAKHNLQFYNYNLSNGLGILTKRVLHEDQETKTGIPGTTPQIEE